MSRTIDLTRLMAYPVHPPEWDRTGASRDYRITTTYDGEDLVNGGPHRAVDLGNLRTHDPIYAPASCRAMGLRHWDGAIGVRLELGPDLLLDAWHLDSTTVAVGAWTPVAAGQIVGRTGRSGQVTGAHTHLELTRAGRRRDPTRYLLGLARLPILEDDDMQLPVADYLMHGTVHPGTNLRYPAPRGELAGSGEVAGGFDSPTRVAILYRAPAGKPYTITIDGRQVSSTAWYGVKLPGPDYREVAALLVTDLRPAAVLRELLPDLDGGEELRTRVGQARSLLVIARAEAQSVASRAQAALDKLAP